MYGYELYSWTHEIYRYAERVTNKRLNTQEYRPFRFQIKHTEAVFLNLYGAQESIPRNQFRQPM
jgi:hypothetical protein